MGRFASSVEKRETGPLRYGLGLSQRAKTCAVQMVPPASTQTPTPTWVKLPNMLERWALDPAKAPKMPPTEPPMPTFSPTDDQGGTRDPTLEWARPPLSAMYLAQLRAYEARVPLALRPGSPFDERTELIRL